MAQDIVMPKLAMGMSEGTITSWNFAQGDYVEKDQVVLEIETEKVSYEIEATGPGYLAILVAEGETVPVDTPIAQLTESADQAVAATAAEAAPAAETAEAGCAATDTAKAAAEDTAAPAPAAAGGRIIASPLAKKMASLEGLDLSQMTGTGPNGRIVKRDVLAALKEAPAAAAVPAASAPAAAGDRAIKATIPVKGMRKAIADNMMQSFATSAQMSVTAEYDASELVALRKRLVAKEDKLGVRVSFADLFVMIVARAAKQVPIANSSIVGDEICLWEDVNLGIATALEFGEYESGLVVPVIKDAGCKSLTEISREVRDKSSRASSGELGSDELTGGTITMSSVAFFTGMVSTTPILNPGQAMLVQPGPIEKKAVVVDDEIVIRPMMKMSYTFDHRIVDGVPLGRFSQAVKDLIEDPDLLL